jgi:hypothetical protein
VKIMTSLFLTIDRPDGTQKQFAILNLDSYFYIDGIEETEEWPDGAQSRVYSTGGHVMSIPIPYRKLADLISETIKKSYIVPEKINEERRTRALEDTKEMMKEVMREFADHHK